MKILNKKFNKTNNCIVQFACKSCACDSGCSCNINTNPYTHKTRSTSSYTSTKNIFYNNNIELK